MQQLAIFSEPRARRTDPDTSFDAARDMPKPGGLEHAILRAFSVVGPMSDDELCELLGEDVYAPTAKTCRSRLVKRGLLVPTSERRPSWRGRDQIVWRLA